MGGQARGGQKLAIMPPPTAMATLPAPPPHRHPPHRAERPAHGAIGPFADNIRNGKAKADNIDEQDQKHHLARQGRKAHRVLGFWEHTQFTHD